jgi:hypothetical protein
VRCSSLSYWATRIEIAGKHAANNFGSLPGKLLQFSTNVRAPGRLHDQAEPEGLAYLTVPATGWWTFVAFQQHAGKAFDWLLSKEALQAFVGYSLIEKKLKPTSVKTYLSSLVKLHKLKSYPDFKLEDGTIAALLYRAANLLMSGPAPLSMNRRVMTLPILQLFGHQLVASRWLNNTQQTIWAACLGSFFSSARMGELLAPHEVGLDPTTSLTWNCVQFRVDGSMLIHIRLPKISTKEGNFLDLFPFPDPPYCLVAALTKMFWQQKQKEAGHGRPGQAIFTYTLGKQLNREGLNVALKVLQEPIFDPKAVTASERPTPAPWRPSRRTSRPRT